MNKLIFAGFILLGTVGAAFADGTRYSASIERPYEDVLDDVEIAVGEHNFRLTGGNQIGGAIGKRHDIAFPRSHIVHFCNLEYARQFLEAAPDFLLHMPCKVVVYEQDGRVVVEARLLPEDDPRVAALTREVNGILKAIVDYATEE